MPVKEVSSRLGVPIPTESSDPWIDAFITYTDAFDSAVFATRETDSLILTEGGTVNFSNGILTWTSDIIIKAPTSGFILKIPQPGPGLAIQDGDFFYVNTVRAPLTEQTLTAVAGQTIPNTGASFVVGVRKGSKFYTRNGRVIDQGQSFALFSQSSAIGGGGGSGGQSVFARVTNVAIGPQGPDIFDVGVAQASTTQITLCARTDKAVTAGTMTIRIGNQSGPIAATTLTSAVNGGVYVTYINQAGVFAVGDLISLEVQTDGAYTHNTGGFASLKISAELFS